MSKKTKIGTVISIKNNKTIIINVQTRYQHPLYSKIISKIKRYTVHDPNGVCYIGDKILIEETRPISLNKCWILKYIYK